MSSGPPTLPAEPQPSIDVDTRQWLDLVASEHGPTHPSTRLVLFVLSLDMRNGKGDRCYPSQERIAKRSGLSLRAVRMHLHRAEEGHWVGIYQSRREGGRAWHVNEYVRTVPVELAEHIKPKRWEDPDGQRPAADTRQGLPPVERDTRQKTTRHPAKNVATPGKKRPDTRQGLPHIFSETSLETLFRDRAAHAERVIEITPEERQRRAEEEARRLADEQERQRAAKAKKDAEADEQRRANVIKALKQLPDYTPADIAKCSGSSVEEVEQLRSQA